MVTVTDYIGAIANSLRIEREKLSKLNWFIQVNESAGEIDGFRITFEPNNPVTELECIHNLEPELLYVDISSATFEKAHYNTAQ